jgi:hypothetical protein
MFFGIARLMEAFSASIRWFKYSTLYYWFETYQTLCKNITDYAYPLPSPATGKNYSFTSNDPQNILSFSVLSISTFFFSPFCGVVALTCRVAMKKIQCSGDGVCVLYKQEDGGTLQTPYPCKVDISDNLNYFICSCE